MSPEAKEPVSDRVIEAKHGSMQIEMRRGSLGLGRCIEVVTEDRMAQLHHVDAQLVGAAGDRLELDQGAVGLDPLADVVGDGAAAMLEVDLLARTVFPVDTQRQIDGALEFLHLSPDPGVVVLLGLAILKLAAEGAGGLCCLGDHQYP